MSAPLLVVRKLCKSFPGRGLGVGRGRPVHAVRDVSFALDHGRTLGLVGESGSGKTTIARLLARLIEPDQGQLMLQGEDLAALSGRALRAARRRIQIVAQDPLAAFDPRITALSAIAAVIRLHGLRPERQIADRVGELCALVGLPAGLEARFPHQLSGGQIQRLAIARALAAEPALLILDEVLSSLDALSKAQVMTVLQHLQRDRDRGFVFISHDIAAVRQMAHTVGVLLDGRLVEFGPAEQLFGDPRHPYTSALLSAGVGSDGPDADSLRAGGSASTSSEGSGCGYADRCPLGLPRCRLSAPPETVIGAEHHRSCCFRADEPRTARPLPLLPGSLSQNARLRIGLMSGRETLPHPTAISAHTGQGPQDGGSDLSPRSPP